jgi:hypothetical protein
MKVALKQMGPLNIVDYCTRGMPLQSDVLQCGGSDSAQWPFVKEGLNMSSKNTALLKRHPSKVGTSPVDVYKYKSYYIYASCQDPEAHFFTTSMDGKRGYQCSRCPHERYIVVPGHCKLCSGYNTTFMAGNGPYSTIQEQGLPSTFGDVPHEYNSARKDFKSGSDTIHMGEMRSISRRLLV